MGWWLLSEHGRVGVFRASGTISNRYPGRQRKILGDNPSTPNSPSGQRQPRCSHEYHSARQPNAVEAQQGSLCAQGS